jgi:hypothetical protein
LAPTEFLPMLFLLSNFPIQLIGAAKLLRSASSLFLLAFCWLACQHRALRMAERPQLVIFLPEHLDTLLSAKSADDGAKLSIATLRDHTDFCRAFAAKLGPRFVKDDWIDSTEFPSQGRYRWKNAQAFGEERLEVVLSIDTSATSVNLSFLFYNDQKLYCQNRPDIVAFVDSLARATLFNQAIVKDPRGHRRRAYLPDSLEKHFIPVLLQEFQALANARFPQHRSSFDLDIEVDCRGAGSAEKSSDCPEDQWVVFSDWLRKKRFPIVIYDTTKDTAEYTLELRTWVCDSTIINPYLRNWLRGIPPSEEDFTEARLLPANSVGCPQPLLMIITQEVRVHFYEKTGQEVRLAGQAEEDLWLGLSVMRLEDFDLDGTSEVVVESGPNMNGNRIRCIFH